MSDKPSMTPMHDCVDAIVELINSSPRSPRKLELLAVLEKYWPKEAGAQTADGIKGGGNWGDGLIVTTCVSTSGDIPPGSLVVFSDSSADPPTVVAWSETNDITSWTEDPTAGSHTFTEPINPLADYIALSKRMWPEIANCNDLRIAHKWNQARDVCDECGEALANFVAKKEAKAAAKEAKEKRDADWFHKYLKLSEEKAVPFTISAGEHPITGKPEMRYVLIMGSAKRGTAGPTQVSGLECYEAVGPHAYKAMFDKLPLAERNIAFCPNHLGSHDWEPMNDEGGPALVRCSCGAAKPK